MTTPKPSLSTALVEHCRSQFPALARRHDGQEAVYLDGPAGTQVPQSVIDAISHYFSTCNANHGGLFS
ncbi:MAG: aminotransferase class V-fold PLP-dependent enzyme, partial [Pirellulaceae bacterium]|nr:aminotransferase class V-fold PLP-dependent enzyme [Pirellulaceae bacterium]